jgi:hypothetical protein
MPRRKHTRDTTPRAITARFDSICPETGKQIRKGDECIYFPAARKTYHAESRTASQWRAQAFADAFHLGDANW